MIYSNSFDDEDGQVLTLTSNATTAASMWYTLTSPATGKITIEYKLKVETKSDTFQAKAFFKTSGTGNPPTIINVGMKGGKVNLSGTTLSDSSYTVGEWNAVKIEVDLDAKTYEVFVNGVSVTPGGKTWSADANDLNKFCFCAENDVGTAYFDDVVITAFSK